MKKIVKYFITIIFFSIATALINVVLTGDITSLDNFFFGLSFWMILSLVVWTIVFLFVYFKDKK